MGVMKSKLTIMAVLSIITLTASSAYSGPYWAKSYGGSGNELAWSIQQTRDSGYIVAGQTTSYGAGYSDYWVLKLDSNGDIKWQKTYGGCMSDEAHSVRQTYEGGYIVAGSTTSYGAGGYDIWVLKLNDWGEVEWQRTYGGCGDEFALSVDDTNEGGFIVAGYTNSFGAGADDFWVFKLDGNGDIEWQKTYGGNLADYARYIQQTRDGGYIAGGYTESYGGGRGDIWVLKLDESGNVQWQKTYGDGDKEKCRTVQQTYDGGYIVAGGTFTDGAGTASMYVLKLDSNGGIEWQKIYGGCNREKCRSIQQTRDGGYIAAGFTESYGAGYDDMWVLKLDESGNVQWQETYGGVGEDSALSVCQTIDGGYAVTGTATSYGVGEDCLVLKLDRSGIISDCNIIAATDADITDAEVEDVNTSVTAGTSEAVIKSVDVLPQSSSAEATDICFNGISEVWGDVYINGSALQKGEVTLLQSGEANQAIKVNQGYYGFRNVVYDKPVEIRIKARNGTQ